MTGTDRGDADKPRLAVATLSPEHYGGILALMRAVYAVAQQDYTPTLCFARPPTTGGPPLLRTLRRALGAGAHAETFEGMDCVAIDQLVRAFNRFKYADPKGLWTRTLASFDAFFCVGASAHSAWPLLRAGKRYSLWVATPYLDDRLDRRARLGPLGRCVEALDYPLSHRQEGAILRAAVEVLALSPYTRDRLIAEFALEPERVRLVPYPIDSERLTPGPRKPPGSDVEVVFSGRYADPRKNATLLLEAFARARAQVPGLHLTLLGDEAPRELAEQAARVGGVRLLGRLSDEAMRGQLQRADVFALASNQEGLCISALEAMACGLPVVSTRCGGPESFVVDGENGLLVACGDAEALAARLVDLARKREMREAFGAAARSRIEAGYSRGVVEPLLRDALARACRPVT